MEKRKLLQVTIVAFAAIGLLAGCMNPGPVTVPTQEPDQLSILATSDALRTQVAESVYQSMTATALANPPTETPLPTETSAPTETSIPTAVPLPTLTTGPVVNTPPPTIAPTRVIIYPTVTPTKGDFQCVVTKQSISYGMRIGGGTDFDAKWTVKNIGNKDWASGAVDYSYVDGEEMHKYDDAYDLNQAVDTGDTVDIVVDMIAPKDSGNYRAIWRLSQDGTTMCYLQVDIRVP